MTAVWRAGVAWLAVTLAATAAVLHPAEPARASAAAVRGASAGVDATPTTIWTTGQRIHVTWSGMTPRSSVYIDQCDNMQAVKPQAFDYGSDCATISEQAVDGQTYNVAGSGATGVNGAVDPDFKTFLGPEPSGTLGWGCGPDGSPDGVQVGGRLVYNPCLLRIADNAPATPVDVVYVKLTMGLPGAAPPAAIRLSPDSLTFPGATAVGATSAPRSVKANAAGSIAPTIGAVGLSGIDPLDFHLAAGSCTGVALAPGAPGCSVALTFSPLKAGTRTATLTWFDTVPTDPPVVVTVSGTGTGGLSPAASQASQASETGPPGLGGHASTASPARKGITSSSTANASGPVGRLAPSRRGLVPWVLAGALLAVGVVAAIALRRRTLARRQ
jgi:hypothetical protein